MKHRKESHITAVGPCRKLVDGNCNFTSESCWWNHAENISENVQCFICNKTFDNKTDMMGHRKKNHSSIIQKCSRFEVGECRFQKDYCWFIHRFETKDENTGEPKDLVDEIETDDASSFFQDVINNTKPPSNPEKQNKKAQN